MQARVHYVLGVLITIAGFLAGFFGDGILGPLLDKVWQYVHPLPAFIVLWLLPPIFWFASAFLAQLAYFAVIPARCPKCGDRSYRHHEPGSRLSRYGAWITYRCGSCGHIQNTGWYEGRGG
jgi:hypothetical protein